ncbi:biotin-independent malonate decarboxylase subunit beta [Paenibacillus xylanexedens]|uniref:biotin-independent malonate decarboxylase subunit beta n=1 Tax=Paenibacillus xylanexedens TaxID=528191 RepID=UPI000AE21F65|nr:biotin-independent malonate decarboxylase subunit beta [Paenibacillus xylanexedens]
MNNKAEWMAVKESFIELRARDRAKSVLDEGTFRELIDPFQRVESPHLPLQGIVPQSDDGVVTARGTIDGQPAVVIALEGAFQGGGIGEVCGAKIAGALELALQDHEQGVPTRPVLLLETGGVRLQEGNYGLLAIAEIGAAIVALRPHTPVVSVISGMIGCYGGMSICAAGLSSHLIMTRQGRMQLNGSEVIEQEAGIAELDSGDKQKIWSMVGGKQRVEAGFADQLVEDDIGQIKQAIRDSFEQDVKKINRSAQVNLYQHLLAEIGSAENLKPEDVRELWKNRKDETGAEQLEQLRQGWVSSSNSSGTRGEKWFNLLADHGDIRQGEAPSVLCADGRIGEENVRFISVVPDPNARFVRARNGEVGLDEGWSIAAYVREAIEADQDGQRRTIVAIVDVPSQAYGYREELLGIHLACAAAADAYASARLAGHPVIALIVGNAISGAFLAHGMQSNRLIAFNDPEVTVQVMSKQSAARITRRSIDELNEAATKVPGAAYDVQSFAKLGALHQLVDGINAFSPDPSDVEKVQRILTDTIQEIRQSPVDLRSRLTSEAAQSGRAASVHVRKLLKEQWNQ